MDETRRKVLFDNSPYMVGWKETREGERFTGVTVGAGVSVIPIRRRTSGLIEITLIREPRLETKEPLLKAAGGYLRGRTLEEAARQILHNEVGYACVHLHVLVSRMEGFTVIELPIATCLALECVPVAAVSSEICPLPLDEAIELVLEQKIPDQCNADAIMRIALLEARRRLPL